MDFKRKRILQLHLEGKRPCQILAATRKEGICRSLIDRTLRRWRMTGTIVPKKKTGRPRTVRTKQLVKVVRERIRRNPCRSSYKLAQDLSVSRKTIRSVLKDDLGLLPYKKRRIHGLSEANKKNRIIRCRELLRRHGDSLIVFSDEKNFVLQQSFNAQNDRVYAAAIQNIPPSIRAVQRFQNHTSVMVWGAICAEGRLPLLFIDKGVKINATYYVREVLENHLKKHASTMFGNRRWVFQQDSAPSHGARITQAWCTENLPDFIPKELWPASSPDANPLDFSIWGIMEAQFRNLKPMGIEKFKATIQKIWDEVPENQIRAACNAFPKRLKAIIRAKGERIEM